MEVIDCEGGLKSIPQINSRDRVGIRIAISHFMILFAYLEFHFLYSQYLLKIVVSSPQAFEMEFHTPSSSDLKCMVLVWSSFIHCFPALIVNPIYAKDFFLITLANPCLFR